MRISRIYLPFEPSAISTTVEIKDEKAHYIKNVLRLKVNHIIEFFISNGNQYQGVINQISKHEIKLIDVKLTAIQPTKSVLDTTIAQGISSSDRMDFSIQKAAELGCNRLIPFISDFCSQKIPVHKYEKKLKHWHAVAISACEQSGRSDLMKITPIIQLKEIIKEVKNGIYLEPTAHQHLKDLPECLHFEHTFFIGPEGGFSPSEIELFAQNDYFGVQLGPRVLRTETVAPAIMGAMHALYGDFKPLAE